MRDDNLETLAARIWSQHKEALEFLMERRPDGDDGVFAQLYDNREEAATRMAEACGFDIVADDSSKSIIRFAVRKWDGLPHFLTAQDYTSSKRLILLELQRNGDKQLLCRFVLGRGDQDVRMRYLQALNDAGQPTTRRNVIKLVWTRLATRSISFSEDDEGDDPAGSYDRVLRTLEAYAREIVRGYDEAFGALR